MVKDIVRHDGDSTPDAAADLRRQSAHQRRLGIGEQFSLRLAEALRLRLFPNTKLTAKGLAHGIGRSDDTVGRWLSGATDIRAADLDLLADYFARNGDRDFLPALFSPAAQVAAPSADRCLWVVDDGIVHEAPAGLAEFVRRALGLPIFGVGDPVAYAIRNLGWIALVEGPSGLAVSCNIAYVGPRARARMLDWLAQARPRRVRIEDGISAAPLGMGLAQAMALFENPYVEQVNSWRSKRLDLNRISDTHAKVVQLISQQKLELLRLAEIASLTTTMNLILVDGPRTITLHVGSDLPISQTVVGKDLRERRDTDYGAMIHRDIREAAESGLPVRHRVRANFGGEYDRLTVPQMIGPDRHMVLTVIDRIRKPQGFMVQ